VQVRASCVVLTGGGLPLQNPRVPWKIFILRNSDEQNLRLGYIDGLLRAEIFRTGMVFRVSHHKSLSDPIYYPYLQIRTFAFSVWLHIFDHDFHVRFRHTELCSEHRSVLRKINSVRPPTERGLQFSALRQYQYTCCCVLWTISLCILCIPEDGSRVEKNKLTHT